MFLPGGDHVLDRADACCCGGDLYVEVGAVNPGMQALRLVVARLTVVGEVGVDLPGDVAV